jgi:hypothetical protein
MKIKEVAKQYGLELNFTTFKEILLKDEKIVEPKDYYYEKYGHYKNYVRSEKIKK